MFLKAIFALSANLLFVFLFFSLSLSYRLSLSRICEHFGVINSEADLLHLPAFIFQHVSSNTASHFNFKTPSFLFGISLSAL
jgi:hypothetical protein